MKYKILIHNINEKPLVFKVNSYTEIGSFIEFKDEFKGQIKRYPIENCEIIVLTNGDEYNG
jgi:uncharacterized protein YkvS